MARGESAIAKQVGPKGYYGKVTLEVQPGDGNGSVSVDFDETRARAWRDGARFGIEYVLEHIPKRKYFPKGGRVFVDRIEGHEVDTSSVLIAYLTVNAFLEALGIEPTRRPGLDETSGTFSFPK